MPIVKSSSGENSEELKRVKSGAIADFAAFVPSDDGTDVLAVFRNIVPVGKVAKHGLILTADMAFAEGAQEVTKYGSAKAVRVHLCGKKSCDGHDVRVHVGEWAYLDPGKTPSKAALATLQPGEVRLLNALQTVRKNPTLGMITPVKDKTPSKRADFEIFSPPVPPPGLPVSLVEWCQDSEVPEMAELLARQGFRSPGEMAGLEQTDIDALFATEAVPAGARARFRLAVKTLKEHQRAREEAEAGSGWFDAETRAELPASMLRGAGLGGPECLRNEEYGIGWLQMPKRGWIEIHRGRGSALPSPPEVTPPGPGFCEPGPLEELARNARQLLSRMEGSEGQHQVTPAPRPTLPRPASAPPAVELKDATTPGGRLLASAGTRSAPRPVALKVDKTHAAAIWEEWSQSGTLCLQDSVASRGWKSVELKRAVFDMARALDVMAASGLDVTAEPAAEVMLRAIAASWFADRYPKEADVAEWLKESSMANFGVPRGMLEEARTMRKLTAKATKGEADGA